MTARDIRYGRQGGRIVPWDDDRPDVNTRRRCDVCGGPLVLGQPCRHWSCTDECTTCHRPVGPTGQNCQCKARRPPQRN